MSLDLPAVEQNRAMYGFWLVLAGLAVVLVVYYFAMEKVSTAADVGTVLSPVTAVIGAIVGAFFGIQVGSSGKAKAERDKDKAERERNDAVALERRFAALLQPDQAAHVRRAVPLDPSPAEQKRVMYEFWTVWAGFAVVLAGFAVVLVVYYFAMKKVNTAADVATVLGPITGVIGTIVGAFFGVKFASIGKAGAERDKKQADGERKDAEDQALRLAALLPPDQAARALRRE